MLYKPFISIIIPAYNEEYSLGSVIHNTQDILEKIELPYEIIVINDGSVDNTPSIAKKFGVTLVNNVKNLGKGATLIKGFRRARGDIILTLDADGSHRPEDIPFLLNPLLKNSNIDATLGTRFIDEIGKRSTSRLHLVGNRIINLIILLVTGRFVSDSQCGFRAYKKRALKTLSLHSTGFDIEGEMTIKILKKGFRLLEVPIRCDPRENGLSRINSFQDGYNIVRSIIKATFYSYLG